MKPLSLSRILAFWADRQPNEIAVHHEADSVTWAELDSRTNRLARAYADLGVKPNDLVTIGLPNSIEFLEATFAIWKLGATPQPISAKLPKFERDQIIELGKPVLVVGVPDGEHPAVASVPAGFHVPETVSDEALPERTADSFKAMTSGGSTGRPKLIVAGAKAHWNPEWSIYHMTNQSRVLVPGPLYHNGPFTFALIGLFNGSQLVLTTRFDAETTLSLIDTHEIKFVYTVPTMMQRIWNLPEATRSKYDLSSIKVLWHMGAPCPAWLKEAFIDWLGGEKIWELYGGTEGQGATTIRGDEWLRHRGSVGKPNSDCEMKVVGEQGETLAPGETGEIYMRHASGPGSTYRYVGAEAKAIEGGWESIGDIGTMDEDGYLYLSDRLTDMILSGGANIYPAEVEAAIDAFPGVRSSAVIGLPHVDLGHAVHAIVDTADQDLSEEGLRAHLAERLVRYKIPQTLEFVHEPLRDDAGKLRRKALRDERSKSR